MLKSRFRAVFSKLSIPLWVAILLSAAVPVLAAQQHRANLEPAAIGPNQVTGVITVAPTTLPAISEPNGSANFTISLDSQPTADVTIGISTIGECAASTSAAVLTATNWSTGFVVTVTAIDDFVDDGTQSCTVETATSASDDLNFHDIDPADVQVDVLDDDTAGFDLSKTTLSVTEGGATDTFTINLTSEPLHDVTVNLSTGSQCTAAPTSLTFTNGNWNSPRTVTVSAVDDDVVDGSQACAVTGTASSDDVNYAGPIPSVSVTAHDNDTADVQVSPTSFSVAEGASSSFTIGLTSQPVSSVTIDLTAGSECSVNPTSVTFTASDWEDAQPVEVTGVADGVVDGPQECVITTSTPAGDPGYSGVSVDDVVVMVTDGDGATVQFAQAVVSTGEGGVVTLDVTLSAPVATEVTVNVNVTGGTATQGADFTLVNSSVTFAPNDQSETVTINTHEDNIDEGMSETINLALSLPPESVVSPGTQTTAVVTIDDNDQSRVYFDSGFYSIGEGEGQLDILVRLSTPSAALVTIDYFVSGGSATPGVDFTGGDGTAEIPVGQTSTTITLQIIDDDIFERNDEIVLLSLSPPNGAVLGTQDSTSVTIEDNDTKAQVEFGEPGYTVNEGEGSVTIDVTLSNPVANLVSVQYTTSDGSAAAPGDYTARSGTLNFSPGTISRTLNINIVDDAVHEGPESFTLILSNPLVPQDLELGPQSTTTVLIIDNEGPTAMRFASATYTVTESAGAATINVVRSGTSNVPVGISYATTTGGTATAGVDYTAVSGELNFGPNETSKSFTVPILPDQISEGNETVNLVLTDPVGPAVIGEPGTAVLTIEDSNETPAVQFSQPTYSVDESMLTADITVTLSVARVEPVNVFYGVQEGTATQGEDFGTIGGELTIPAGETIGTFSVSLLPDQIDEPDETVLLSLNDAVGAVIGERATASLIIVDNDEPPTVSFSLSSLTVGETDGMVNLPVRLSTESGRTVTVDYRTINGSAIAGSDYIATSGTLTFAPARSGIPGETSKIIQVPLLEGLGGEPNETFIVELSAPANATLTTPDRVVVTIVDGELVRYTRFFPITNYLSLGEPNNSCSEAYEIMVSQTYFFAPDDAEDWYRFTLTESGNLFVDLENFAPSLGQLALLKGDTCEKWDLLGHIGNPDGGGTIDAGFQGPGNYFIYVANDETPTFETYELRVRLEAE